jgi:hypothetical protein
MRSTENASAKPLDLGALGQEERVAFRGLVARVAKRIGLSHDLIARLDLSAGRSSCKCQVCDRYPKEVLIVTSKGGVRSYLCADFNDCDKFRKAMDTKAAQSVLKYMRARGLLDSSQGDTGE